MRRGQGLLVDRAPDAACIEQLGDSRGEPVRRGVVRSVFSFGRSAEVVDPSWRAGRRTGMRAAVCAETNDRARTPERPSICGRASAEGSGFPRLEAIIGEPCETRERAVVFIKSLKHRRRPRRSVGLHARSVGRRCSKWHLTAAAARPRPPTAGLFPNSVPLADDTAASSLIASPLPSVWRCCAPDGA